MSADAWRVCPKCKENRMKAEQREYDRWRESYGKVSLEEFERNRPALEDEELEETLREDYEAFLDEDYLFYFNYSANCTECDFRFNKRIQKDISE